MPDLALEAGHGGCVAGVDEAGRGPWAGPVVAAAVIFEQSAACRDFVGRVDDSKRLGAKRRQALLVQLRALVRSRAAWIGIGHADVAEIDRINILAASLEAMRRAVSALARTPSHVLIDGQHTPQGLACSADALIKGDARSASIAAASIVAKVTRDRWMAKLARRHPGYGWERNAGYGTAEHRDALHRLGPTPQHRTSFAPIRQIMYPFRKNS